MKSMSRVMRSELVNILMESSEDELKQFAQDLIGRGQYTEATEDEIETFMELV